MARHRNAYGEDNVVQEEEVEDEYGAEDIYSDKEEDDDEDYGGGRGGGGSKKRRRSDFIDNVAEDDEEDDEDEYGAYDGSARRHKKNPGVSFIDDMALEADDDDEEEDDGEDEFIVDPSTDIPGDDNRRMHRRPLLPREELEEDIDDFERRIQERYAGTSQAEYDEETTDVEQQALLPSVRDPKLWMVKCAIGREKEVAV